MPKEQVNTIKMCEHKLDPEFKHIYIIPIFDMHIGGAKYGVHLFAEELFDGYVSWILERPNAFAVLGGDIIAASARGGRTYEIWNQFFNPQQQLEYAGEKLYPLVDRILGVVSGNHEDRIYAQVGLEPMSSLCSMLGVDHKLYGRDGLMVKTSFGPHSNIPFFTYITHGWGGARRTGGQVNKVEELGVLIHADVYLTGHEHTLFMSRNEYQMPSKNLSMRLYRKLFLGCGCFCEYTPYLQSIGRRHPDLGAPRVRMEIKHSHDEYTKDCHVSI